MGLSVFIMHAQSNKRMTLGTNVLETKLIAISFKDSFSHACVLSGIMSLKPCNKLHKLFQERGDALTSGWGWPEHVARAFLILSYFCGKPWPIKAIFSGQGKTKEDFLCATLCDMKIDG